MGSYPECGQHDEARVCVYPYPAQSSTPSWTGTSHLGCLVWDAHCGLYLWERCEGPCEKSTLSDTSNAASSVCRPVWPGVLVWTCARLFLALTHLPVAVSLLAPTPGSGVAEENLLWCTETSACNGAAAATAPTWR